MVHYSLDSVRWECRELNASLEFPWHDRTAVGEERLFDSGDLSVPVLLKRDKAKFSKAEDEEALVTQRLAWMRLVERYTRRSLTKQIDILPAVSGIAQAIARSTSDEYFGGLWESYLPRCLLWRSTWTIEHGLATHSRPIDYLAPSWSWASIRGPVDYPSYFLGSSYSWNSNPDPHFIPKIISVTCDPSGSDAFGTLAGGKLCIEGKVSIGFTKHEQYSMPGKQHRQDVLATAAGTKVGEINWDIPSCPDCAPTGKIEGFFILCCMNSTNHTDGSFRTFGIALQPAEDSEISTNSGPCFRRVGLVWGISPAFWSQPPVTVTRLIII
jgi:hypothetical protein